MKLRKVLNSGAACIALLCGGTLITSSAVSALTSSAAVTQAASSGTISAGFTEQPTDPDAKKAFLSGTVDPTKGNFVSLHNFGTDPLKSVTVTVLRSAINGVMYLYACSGTWNETAGTCSVSKTAIVTLTSALTGSSSFTVSLAPNASSRLQLWSTVGNITAIVSASVSNSDISPTVLNY